MTLSLAGTSNGTTHVALEQGLLDDVYDKFNSGRINEGMNELLPGLKSRRLTSGSREWAKLVEVCLAHPLRNLLHQDPFTWRAFSKPRGYAGDAVLLDYMYGREEGWPPPEGISDLGRMIFEYTTRSAACEGVRARRGFIANLLDRLGDEVRQPDVLSIAAGHLREAHLSSAVKRRKLGRYVALDSDADSLKEVEHCYGRFGVEVFISPIRRLLTQKVLIGPFDVVYSTGLFDYLQQSTAQRLTWVMFQMLRPRGRLLVANFLPGIADYGYMESYMDWKLIYRTRLEMVEISACIPQAQIRDIRIFAEENQNIIFLQVTKQ
jgi:extracellular factor (EF) 3-hydroxypalmitic acid methyl ester biosynthesis protein